MVKETKIVCTIGPAGESVDMLINLVSAGTSVCHLNFSHGDYEEHDARIENIREAVKVTGKRVAILLDTKGPEIRTNDMENGIITVEINDSVHISMTEVLGTNERFSITYPELVNDVNVGSHIFLDGGLIDLEVTNIDHDANEIVTVIKSEGVLKNKKGVNVPGVSVDLPGITEKDANDIRFGIGQRIGFIAANFIHHASDVLETTRILEEENTTHTQVIPGIENQGGIDSIDEILKVSDGLMVAHGGMGVEIPAEDAPIVQKALVKKCNALGKPAITVTQMLGSVQRNPHPTHTETNDVANTIYDRTDAVMLSDETTVGDYPLETVQIMVRVAVRTEETLVSQDLFALKLYSKTSITETIEQSVGHTAHNLGIQTVVAATESGHTAHMISKYRPEAHIIAITFSEQEARSLSLSWGVCATVANKPSSTDEMFSLASKVSQEEGYTSGGDLIIVTAGIPVGEKGTINLMKIQMVGSKLVQDQGIGEEAIIAETVVTGTAEEVVAEATGGVILITETIDREYIPVIEKASALVVEEGGLTSHTAVVAIAQNIPVVIDAADATSLIDNDEVTTVNPRRDIIYRGATAAI